MAEFAFTLTARPVLGGADMRLGDNRIRERDDLAIVSVAIPLGGETALADAIRSAWDLAPPAPAVSSVSGDIRAVSSTGDQWLVIFPHATPDANAHVQTALAGSGYTTEQTDAWVVLEISGPDTLAALERICPLDCAAMPVDGNGRTVVEHMGALILRLDADRFLMMSASSSAASFLHAVETSYRYVQQMP
ncbi:MAG: sarcosine oxidase subunit gamma [Marinibacterium sp.]